MFPAATLISRKREDYGGVSGVIIMEIMQCGEEVWCGREMGDYRLKITVNCLCVFDGRLLN